jgi:hypothetical protein
VPGYRPSPGGLDLISGQCARITPPWSVLDCGFGRNKLKSVRDAISFGFMQIAKSRVVRASRMV